MSPLLRDCIAHAVQAGKAQGHAAQCKVVEGLLARVLAEAGKTGAVEPTTLLEIMGRLAAQRGTCQRLALAAESAVERLALELEHPCARLARRVLRAARAAAQAWRGPQPS
jgi:hypothetical protein